MSAGAGKNVRLLPALIVTLGVVLSLRAVAAAEEAVEGQNLIQPPAPEGAAEEEGGGDGAEGQTPAPAAPACPAPSFADVAGLSQSEVAILQSLGQRRTQLEARAAEIETRVGLLTAAERRVEERVAELRRLEGAVNELLGRLDQQQEQRLAGLVDVYQRMRARDAAEVFDGLDDDTMVEVASRMRQQSLAEVMGQMQPERARTLTRLLAARARPGDPRTLLGQNRPPAPPPAAPAPAR